METIDKLIKLEMNMIKIILCLSSLLFISCLGSEFERERITNDYYLTTTDNYNKDVYINFKLQNGDFVGVVSATVFSVGYNEKYIIARQHPFDYPNKVDTSIIKYYIIPIYKKSTFSPEEGVLGPLSLRDFKSRCVTLGISNVRFSKNIF